ncbi:MAG: LuxR family transcriptional regulator [Pseudomonadota bacterium]
MQSVERYLREMQSLQTSEDLWRLGIAYFKSRHIHMVSYHHVPPIGAPDHQDVHVVAEGFPDAWVEKYVRRRLFDFDPIPTLALQRSDPYRWSDVGQLMTLSQDQIRFLEELRNAELGDGLAIPVFGPGGRNGYVGLGFDPHKAEVSNIVALKELQWVCQATHLKFCEVLAPKLRPPTSLSPQEKSVLRWVARGKSNADISAIMGVSQATVDTYLRRIFSKLGVADRVTAAIKGVGSGTITL